MDRKSKAMKNILEETSSQRILLEEYRALNADYLNLRSEGVSRVNFFITAMSVVLGGVLVIASSNSRLPIPYFKLILLTAALILATIGLEIYSYLIQRAISSDRLMRGLARIRNYFVNLDPQVRDYFVTKIYDIPTASLIHKHSGLRRTTQIIEGVFVGLIFTVLSTFLPFAQVMNIGFGVAVTALTIMILEIVARRKLDKAFKSAEAETKFNDDLNT